MVARVHLAPDKLSVPFVTVSAAPTVPWHVNGGIPALDLGLGPTVGPDEVSCPPLAFPLALSTHCSTRASASPADAVQAFNDNGSGTLLALDGLHALRLIIIATNGTDNPGESLLWAPFYLASGQPALPVGDSAVFATRLPEEEAGNLSSLWVHFSAIPLPLDHGLRQLPPSIATLVFRFRFLDRASASALRPASPHFHHQWGDSRLFPPSPSCYRRQRYGFGKAPPLLSTAHSLSSPYFLVHLAWDWLSVTDRRSLASAMPTIADYATLRAAATHLDLSSLQASRPSLDATPIWQDRAYRMATALLCFNFNYGDFVRWLGGEYTGAQRGDATFDIVDSVRTSLVPPGRPSTLIEPCDSSQKASHLQVTSSAASPPSSNASATTTPPSLPKQSRTYEKVYKRGKAILPHPFPSIHLGFHPRTLPCPHHLDSPKRLPGRRWAFMCRSINDPR